MSIRMRYVLIYAGMLFLAATAVNAHAQDYTAEDYYRQAIDYLNQNSKEKAKELFNKGVEQDMKKRSVDDILESSFKSGLITKIERVGYKTDLKEKVYDSDKPSLVFLHNQRGTKNAISRREAIIVKNLALTYSDKIRFLVLDISIEGTYNNTDGYRFGNETRGEGITDTPSIKIYSKFDLDNEETLEKNSGRIKAIDVLNGGPANDYVIYDEWLPFLRNEWIPTNITNPNGSYVWRFNNTFNEKKVFYIK